MTILIDSSVWIDFFRGTPSPAALYLRDTLGRQSYVVGGLMLWQARRLGLPTATAPAAPPPPGERALAAEVFWNSSHTIA